MVKYLKILFFLLISDVLFAQGIDSGWHIVNIKDAFGDETENKRVVYQTTGTFSNSATNNSYIDVLLLVDDPNSISVITYEYGQYCVNLDDAIYTYKIGSRIIDYCPLQGEFDMSFVFHPTHDEKTSLFYILKQGGLIKCNVYQDGSTYRFNVNADGFRDLLSEAFNGKDAYREYYYEVLDINSKKIEVEFELKYKWSFEKELVMRDNLDLKSLVTTYFNNKNEQYAFDRPGGYYQREKIEKEWGEPLLEQIRKLFLDDNIEYESFRAW